MMSRDETRPLATFDVSVDGRHGTIAIAGELDLATREELTSALNQAGSSGAVDVRLDVRAVDFMDAGSIGIFLGAKSELEARGGSLQIQAASPAVLRVLEVLDL